MSDYPKIIAVDFDGCLCVKKWPEIGAANWKAINTLIRRKAEGDKIILWTCREGKMLDEAVLWCLNHGLKFDAVNDNLPQNKKFFGNNCRKIFANEYWDDRAVRVVAGESEHSVKPTVYHKHNTAFDQLKGAFEKWNRKRRKQNS